MLQTPQCGTRAARLTARGAQVYTDNGVPEDSVLYVKSAAVTYSSILIKVFVMLEHAAATGARWLLKTDDDAYVNIPQTVEVPPRSSLLLPAACCASS